MSHRGSSIASVDHRGGNGVHHRGDGEGLLVDVGLSGDLDINVGLGGDLDIDIGLGSGVDVGISLRGVIMSSINTTVGNGRGGSNHGVGSVSNSRGSDSIGTSVT